MKYSTATWYHVFLLWNWSDLPRSRKKNQSRDPVNPTCIPQITTLARSLHYYKRTGPRFRKVTSARVGCNPEIILDPSYDAVLSRRFYPLISFYPFVRYERGDQNEDFKKFKVHVLLIFGLFNLSLFRKNEFKCILLPWVISIYEFIKIHKHSNNAMWKYYIQKKKYYDYKLI